MKDRPLVRLAAESNRRGDPTGWFEVLCCEGSEGDYHPPPHPVGFSDLAVSNRQRTSVADVGLLSNLLTEVCEPDVRRFRVPFRRVKLQVCDEAS
jgi:hypothetical protein